MFHKLIRTDSDYAVTVLRLVLGIVFFAHGAQKALGWFGGHGFKATLTGFNQDMHIPLVFAVLAIAAEFLGGLGLLVGLLSRVAAFGIGCNMVVAIAEVHHRFGFFMNWSGIKKGEGFEFHLLAIAIVLALILKGGGAASIDRVLTARSGG